MFNRKARVIMALLACTVLITACGSGDSASTQDNEAINENTDETIEEVVEEAVDEALDDTVDSDGGVFVVTFGDGTVVTQENGEGGFLQRGAGIVGDWDKFIEFDGEHPYYVKITFLEDEIVVGENPVFMVGADAPVEYNDQPDFLASCDIGSDDSLTINITNVDGNRVSGSFDYNLPNCYDLVDPIEVEGGISVSGTFENITYKEAE